MRNVEAALLLLLLAITTPGCLDKPEPPMTNSGIAAEGYALVPDGVTPDEIIRELREKVRQLEGTNAYTIETGITNRFLTFTLESNATYRISVVKWPEP